MNSPNRFDQPWVCLRTVEGKLLARFNPCANVIEIQHRGVVHTFCLPTVALPVSTTPAISDLPKKDCATSEKQ